EKIYMTTKLKGRKTKFLPFNKDLNNPQPKNESDYKTSYLYQDILQKSQLAKLISNFIYMEKVDENNEIIPIFPRYHQLDCVNKLLENCEPGKNYLIQHSAGSGKTKTIAWLSHGLIREYDDENNRIYDMVIVISDRKVIDKQLQDQVVQIEKVKGIVEKIDKDSNQLKEALKSGTNIVVTTIQKFPFILEEIGDLPKRKYAVIIDEAHSSQTGSLSKKMREVLSTNSLDEAEKLDNEDLTNIDEEILEDIESSRKLPNVTFFAFTATPKNKTLEMFGIKDEFGKYHSFHLYTMKQAIEEGFILDILKNYLTYATYFKLFKKIADDPEYDEKKAKLLLRNFVEIHPVAIDRKTNIMLTHFMNSTHNKINKEAKAMVVTRSRLHAVLYKEVFDKMIREENYPIKTLVAFTGIVRHNEKEYTENSMNRLPAKKTIVNAFREKEYKILIVANKFQTGFDQPLLHTIYVDKILNGITAVQTLSRANRIYPGKNDTLIMDFANLPDVIQKAFQPYYEATILSEGTDPHKLYDLQEKLLDFQIFDQNEIIYFVKQYKRNVSQAKLHSIFTPIIDLFKRKNKDAQSEFKKTLHRYQNIYSFLSQLIPFSDINLEKMYIFNKYLLKKLPSINNPLPYGVLEDVDIGSYKIIGDEEPQDIPLMSGEELNPISDEAGKKTRDTSEKLSLILKELNDAFGTKFSEDDKVFLTRVKNNLLTNTDLLNKIENNSKQNVKAIFDKYFNDEMTELLNNDMGFYKKIVDNEKLRKKLKSSLLSLIYFEYNQMKEIDKNKIKFIDILTENRKFIDALPVYSLKAAAGKFGNGAAVEEQGWVEIKNYHKKLSGNMFVVQIIGNSMRNIIKDGEYAVFKKVSGANSGKIILIEHSDFIDSETGGAYSIKKYVQNGDKIEFHALTDEPHIKNHTSFSADELDKSSNYRIAAVFIGRYDPDTKKIEKYK
ncbi:DEAD/DEAH box helicase family protein, partial [bacterium]|nr:DEAD/DEAH box helicase family protein [bacterium]